MDLQKKEGQSERKKGFCIQNKTKQKKSQKKFCMTIQNVSFYFCECIFILFNKWLTRHMVIDGFMASNFLGIYWSSLNAKLISISISFFFCSSYFIRPNGIWFSRKRTNVNTHNSFVRTEQFAKLNNTIRHFWVSFIKKLVFCPFQR